MAGSVSGISFKVKPEILEKKSQEIMDYSKIVSNRFDDLIQKTNGSASYWEGAAADAFRNKCIEHQDNMERILKRLYEHAKDLRQISLNYMGQEAAINETAADLPSDIL